MAIETRIFQPPGNAEAPEHGAVELHLVDLARVLGEASTEIDGAVDGAALARFQRVVPLDPRLVLLALGQGLARRPE